MKSEHRKSDQVIFRINPKGWPNGECLGPESTPLKVSGLNLTWWALQLL